MDASASFNKLAMLEDGESWINIVFWMASLLILGIWSGRPVYYYATFLTVPIRVCALRAPMIRTNMTLVLVALGLLLDI